MYRLVSLLVSALTLAMAFEAAAVGPGDPAPGFTLYDVHENSVSLADHTGRVVLLAFIGYGWAACTAAGPAVERIWRDFKDRRFQALGLDCWNGNVASVQSFIDRTGITFPVLRDAGYLQSPSHYDIAYDNYIVVDAHGIIRYTSVGESCGGKGCFDAANVRAAILQALPSPVEAQSWSAVKALYRWAREPGCRTILRREPAP